MYRTVVSICTARFNVHKFHFLSTHCIYVFYVDLRTNSDCCLNSGFRRAVNENCALLSCYAASSGISLPTFRDNLSVPSSGVNNPKGKNHYSLRNCTAERSCQFFPCTASSDWSWQRSWGVSTERYEMNVWTFEHAVSGCTNAPCSVYTKSWYSFTAVCIHGLSQAPWRQPKIYKLNAKK
jgi:hypothetical protein